MSHYPRHVLCADGATRIVADHIQHSALTGIEYGPDAQPVTPFEPEEESEAEDSEHEPDEQEATPKKRKRKGHK